MSNIKKKTSGKSDNTKYRAVNWDSEIGSEAFIQHKTLPRCRQKRAVKESVLAIANLPEIMDVTSSASRKRLFVRKVRFCCYVFDFSDEADTESKEVRKRKALKRSCLLDLVNYVQNGKPQFSELELSDMFEMLWLNLFRPLPPTLLDMFGVYDPQEDEPASEPTWPHLHVVYEFLLRLVQLESCRKALEKHLTRGFILNLLDLFDSEDHRERDYLKTVVHRIYGNFMHLRPFIRRSMCNILYSFIYDTHNHNGIGELLEIFGSIINGFAIPLKQQHKVFLRRVLLPLHTAKHLSVFHPQLCYCVTQFLEKDPTLSVYITHALIKFWPWTDSKKSLLYITELESVLDHVEPQHLGDTQMDLFRHISRLIGNPQFQVAERAICLLNNEIVVRYLTRQRTLYVPQLSKPLFNNLWTYAKDMYTPLRWEDQGHWSMAVLELSRDLKDLFVELDQSLMTRTAKSVRQGHANLIKVRNQRDTAWDNLERKFNNKEESKSNQ